MESETDKAFELIFRLPRTVCIFPFSREYRVSVWRLCMSMAVLTAAGYRFFVESVKLFNSSINKLNSFLIVIYYGTLYASILVTLFKTMRKKSPFAKIKSILNRVEKNILDKGIVWRHQLKWYKIDISFTLTLVFLLLKFIRYESIEKFIESLKFFIFFFTTYSLSSAIISQVYGLYSLIASQMCQIKKIYCLDTQVKLNEALVSVTETVTEYYGPQLAFITVGYYISVLNVLTSLFRGNDISTIYAHTLGLLPISQLLMAVISITSQAKKVNEVFHKRLLSYPNDEMLAFHALARRSLKLSACGLFNFDSTLVISLIDFGTTYIVILLQYGDNQ